MDFATGIVIGLIIGWTLNWMIQPLFFPLRRRGTGNIEGLNDTLFEMQARLSALETSALGATTRILTVSEEPRLAQVFVRESDPLEDINGIGPVYAQRLNEAGVYTFEQLAILNADRIIDIIKPRQFQEIDPQGWIDEARLREKGNQNKENDPSS